MVKGLAIVSKLLFGVMGLAVAGSVVVGSTGVLADGGPTRSLKDPGPTPFSWTGFYVGANVGGAWSDLNYGLSTPGSAAAPFFVPEDAVAIGNTGSGGFRTRDFTAGVQAGYNFQLNGLVIGAEVDWGRLGIEARSAVTAPTPFAGNQTTLTSIGADNLVTIRGRLGLVVDRALLYVTGGAAYSQIELAQTTRFTGVPTVDGFAMKQSQWGWTIGGGI